ncbi:MAG TPA: hypothetical protein VNT22_02520, partial [Baekduia sp.]|nr:hypothetical protein [Baekduia sp.]
MTDRTVHIRRAIFAVLALLIGVFIALRAGGIDDSPAEWTSTVVGTIGGALCLWRAAVVRHERGAWMLVGLYLVTWAFADAIWTEQPSPNLSDAFYLTAYAFGIIGLAMLLRARARTSATRTWEWLDALIGGLTVCAVAAAIFFGAMLEDSGADTLEALTTSAYPVLDLSILCLIVVAIGSAGWAVDRVWAALAVGLGVNALADGLYGAATLQGHDWLFAWAE